MRLGSGGLYFRQDKEIRVFPIQEEGGPGPPFWILGALLSPTLIPPPRIPPGTLPLPRRPVWKASGIPKDRSARGHRPRGAAREAGRAALNVAGNEAPVNELEEDKGGR